MQENIDNTTLKIRRPSSFDNVLTLSELSSKIQVYEDLKLNLHTYQSEYFRSYVKTFDEVLAYIPEREYHMYYDTSLFCSLAEYLVSHHDHHAQCVKRRCDKSTACTCQIYIVNTTTHEIYVTVNSVMHNNLSSDQFSFNEDYTMLTVTVSRDIHSCISRPRNPHITGSYYQTFVFDTRTNVLIMSKRRHISRGYDEYWYDVDNFGTAVD